MKQFYAISILARDSTEVFVSEFDGEIISLDALKIVDVNEDMRFYNPEEAMRVANKIVNKFDNINRVYVTIARPTYATQKIATIEKEPE